MKAKKSTVIDGVELAVFDDGKLTMVAFEIETHYFAHICESGNVFNGYATLLRHKTKRSYAGPVGWACDASSDLTLADKYERDFIFEIEAAMTLQKLTGFEFDFFRLS